MEKGFILKARLLEKGIKVTPSAKKVLDKQSDIWLMDDYITCSGITLQYEDEYATIGVEEDSPYELVAKCRKLYITDGRRYAFLLSFASEGIFGRHQFDYGEYDFAERYARPF